MRGGRGGRGNASFKTARNTCANPLADYRDTLLTYVYVLACSWAQRDNMLEQAVRWLLKFGKL